MSPWPARDLGLAREIAAAARDDAWFADRAALLLDLATDRALAPIARHALIELLLDEVEDDVMPPPEPSDLPWSGRLAERLGITPRGARKALSELAGLGLIDQRGAEVSVLPGAIAEHLRRGTDMPQRPEPADPTEAHAARLERLRDLALGDGLISTAVSATRAINRALGFEAPRKQRRGFDQDEDERTRPPHERRALHFERMTRFLRDYYIGDPDYHDDLLAWVAAVRAASGGEAAASQEESLSSTTESLSPHWWGERLGEGGVSHERDDGSGISAVS
ncbi:hypothetical protein [Desertibaculum subflavum]|uniref:hypothetical protein n=1 Tax=Desertibaculum subflavum TaxID=2268458 RepID=UPI0013C400C4